MIKRKIVAFPLLLAPAFLAPVSGMLARQHNPHLLLGLSSSFWAGTVIGAAMVSLAAGIVFLLLPVRSA